MSEQPTDKETPPWPTGEPDDSEPTPERQAELRAAYEANARVGKPSYSGVVIETRGEVNWIVQERGWRREDGKTREQFIDFRRVGVHKAVLNDVDLSVANLSGAYIGNSNFSGAKLEVANLSDAFITGTNFRGAELYSANLSDAFIASTNCSGAKLYSANLSGAHVTGTNFSSAELAGANLSGATITGNLRQVRMDSATLLGVSLFGGTRWIGLHPV